MNKDPDARKEAAISVCGLVKRFGRLRAVDDVSFDIPRGSVAGFIGANGAGKTTAMRIMATLELADEGTVAIAGHDVLDRPAETRRVLGWMPDSYGAYDNMTVWEYLDFFARAYGFGRGARGRRVQDVMEFTDLVSLRDRQMNKLSKGMSQRLCLGRTLLHDPEVLILDEPAAGLDPKARIEFKRLVRILAEEGKTLLISSHILSELAEMCDQMVFIDNGRLVHHGTADSLMARGEPSGTVVVRLAASAADGADAVWRRAEEWVLARAGLRLLDNETAGLLRIALTDVGSEAQAALLKEMVEAGLPICEFRREERRLEDAFVDLVSGQKSPP